jgi:hypothetical protein
MNGLHPTALNVLFGLAMMALTPASVANPAPASAVDPVPQVPKQVTLGEGYQQEGFGPDSGPEGPAEAETTYWRTIPLDHITPELFQSEMDKAFVPNIHPVVLRPGETLHYPIRIEGVYTMIIAPDDRTLAIYTTPAGYAIVRELAQALDMPVRHDLSMPRRVKSGVKPQNYCQSRTNVPVSSKATPPAGVTEAYFFVRIPLSHTTPLAVLDALRHSYVPDSGAMILKAGETVNGSFVMDGVRVIFPNVPDNSLMVVTTADGLLSVKNLLNILDGGKRPVPR